VECGARGAVERERVTPRPDAVLGRWRSRRGSSALDADAGIFRVCGCVWDGPKGSGEEDLLVVSRTSAWYNSFFLSFSKGNVVLPPDDTCPDEDSDEDALAL
jgi:hypothetical protein